MTNAPKTQEPAAPVGVRLVKSIGPGNLRKYAGRTARKEGKAIFCGRVTGVTYGVVRRPNRIDPTKQSVALLGTFMAFPYDAEPIRPVELYLPSVVETSFAAAAEREGGISFALEIWCEPDETPTNTIGYRYTVHDRRQAEHVDPAMQLAIEAGWIEKPTARIEAPRAKKNRQAANSGFDPVTGEVQLEDVSPEATA